MQKNVYHLPGSLHPGQSTEGGPLLSRLTSSSSLPIRFLDNLDLLQDALLQWGAENEKKVPEYSEIELYLNWVQFQMSPHGEYAENSEERIWAESDLYKGLGLLWKITFDECALRQLNAARKNGQIAVIRRLLELASGDIRLEENCVGIAVRPIIVLFSVTEAFNITVLLSPKGRTRELVVIDILCKDAYSVYRNYLKKYREEFSEIREFDQVHFYRSVSVYIGPKIGPRALDSERSAQELTRSSKSLLDFLTRESNCKGFARLLTTMSTFTLTLTPEQERLIGAADNVLAIGRSGTGKTTCALLRIFATEMLHKLKVKRERDGVHSARFAASDVDSHPELHSMFVTVSGYLSVEVKHMYMNLRDLIKQELRIREAQHDGTQPPPPQNSAQHASFSTASMEVESSLNLLALSDADFPVFATFDQLLKGVDGTLQRPFFVRQPGTNKPTPGSQKLGVHREVKGAYIIQALGTQRPSFLVDYEYFLNNFWPRVRNISGGMDPAHVWFEIMAIIKGSGTAYCFSDFHMSQNLYISHGKKKSILTKESKKQVWSIFEEYMHWKEAQGAYDDQDVANYVLYMIEQQGYHAARIHCLMIDEVQDLTPAMLLLLWRITEHQLFLSGDTAQTITKGAGFRFKDMSTISHYDSKYADRPPKIMQLKTSFRSHMQILNLANHIVNLIEIIFPKLIDKLDSEGSPNAGPLPVFVSEKSWLQGIFSTNSVHAPEVTFGSNQVIIVRDEDAKERIPHSLQQALCLSVLDCKGLEFCDVLIYDFFSTSPVKMKEWEGLQRLYADLFDGSEKKIDKAALRVFLEKHPISLQYTLCNDLKMLYVAVTRTRKRYESDTEKVAGLVELWAKLGLLRIATKPTEVSGFLLPTAVTGASAWLEQAEVLMRHGSHREAAKCYRRAGRIREAFHALTMALATEGSSRLNRALAAIESAPSAVDLARFQRELQDALDILHTAAERSRLLGMKSQAGQCYFSAKRYAQAATMFQECMDYQACAECYVHIDFYVRAAFYYEICRDYEKAICCYDIVADWERAVSCIEMMSKIIPKTDLEIYAFHYLLLYFQALAEGSFSSPPVIPGYYIRHFPSESTVPIQALAGSGTNELFAGRVNASESELGQSLCAAVIVHPTVLHSAVSRAERKSPSVLAVLWTSSFERAFNSEIRTVLELLEVLCLPKLACLLANEYRLLSVWQYCAAGLAHSLSPRCPLDVQQLQSSAKCCEKTSASANRAVGELDAELFGASTLREVEADQTLKKALLALGFLGTVARLGGSETLVYQSMGMCALGDGSTHDLFACITAKQSTCPICTLQSSWGNHPEPELHAAFAANRRFWNYIAIDQSPAKLIELITHLKTTFATALQSSDLIQIADCCSVIPLLLCWKETPERLSNSNIFTFQVVMKMTKFLVKAAIGIDSIKKKRSLSAWVTAIDAALAPFQVYRLPSSDLTNCLPTLTHCVISRNSLLFPQVLEKCSNLPYYDISGAWFIVPLEAAAKAFAVHIVKTLSLILKVRHSQLEISDNKKVNLIALVLSEKGEKRFKASALRVAKYADLYGEIGYLFSIQQLLRDVYPLIASRRTSALSTIQESYTKLMRLQGLMDEDEPDEEFAAFMREKNKTEIKQLQAKLSDLRAREFEDFCYRLVYYRQELLFHFDWWIWNFPVTKWARKALLLDAVYDFTCSPADTLTVLACDRIFQACSRRSHFLWLVGERFPAILPMLYPLEHLQKGNLDEVAKWHLRVASSLKNSEELRTAIYHLSMSFLLGWLQCKAEVQCSNALCKLLRTERRAEIQPSDLSSQDSSTQPDSSQPSTEGPRWILFEVPLFHGTINEEQGQECLKESLRVLQECVQLWMPQSERLEGLLKHMVWKYLYFTLSNAQVEREQLHAQLIELVNSGKLVMEEYVDFLRSTNRVEYVNEFIARKKTSSDNKERVVAIRMSPEHRRSPDIQIPRENSTIAAAFQSQSCGPPRHHSLRKVLFANSLGLKGLLPDEGVDCLCFQQFALELVLMLRHECANQRDAQVVLKTMVEVQAAWTDACTSLDGDRLSQFSIAAKFVDQKKKEIEEWKKVPGQVPPWEDKRDSLPKKIH